MPIEQKQDDLAQAEIQEKKQENKLNSTSGQDQLKAELVDISKEEQKAMLNDNVSTPEGRDLIMEKIKSGDITSEVFGEWYAKQTGAEKLSNELQTNLNTMFNDIKGINGAQKELMSGRGMTTILQSVAARKSQ